MNLWLGLLLMLAQVTAAWAAEPRLEPTVQEKAQTLVLLHEPIVMLQAKFGRLDGAARVRLTHERIQRLDPADLIPPITVLKGSRQGQETREFMVNGKRILVLMEGDLEALDELSLSVTQTHHTIARLNQMAGRFQVSQSAA